MRKTTASMYVYPSVNELIENMTPINIENIVINRMKYRNSMPIGVSPR